ncbi:uncharacterized protein LOC110897235 [Helianthus annuus]|uniref:uncharacterized protein LOC110897235 n=1 Tax=Helianthus annuus TaxID=4232 RepID=UPI000B8F6500|nr:uncharacterized protein LOC110897235 [Helianthus annuus]
MTEERLAILVKSGKKVSEEFQVTWKNHELNVWVEEISGQWFPDFLEPIDSDGGSPEVSSAFGDFPPNESGHTKGCMDDRSESCMGESTVALSLNPEVSMHEDCVHGEHDQPPFGNNEEREVGEENGPQKDANRPLEEPTTSVPRPSYITCRPKKSLMLSLKTKDFFLTSGFLAGVADRINIVNIHAPNDSVLRRNLWVELAALIAQQDGFWVLLGDFNDVRAEPERVNSKFDRAATEAFNGFIDNSGLLEFSMTGATDFGPIPFRFYNSWIGEKRLLEIIHSGLPILLGVGKKDVVLSDFLRRIKAAIKKWRIEVKEKDNKDVLDLQECIRSIEEKVADGTASAVEKKLRIDLRVKVNKLESIKVKDLQQKARVIWAKFSDENSSFFHKIISTNLANNRINGLCFQNRVVSDPGELKEEIRKWFRKQFAEPIRRRPDFDGDGLPRLSKQCGRILCERFSEKEVYTAVKNCDGADGLKKVINEISSPVQSAFVDGRNILDNPLIISETVAWAKKSKSKLLIFKVDFEKAYDSINWKFLARMLSKMSIPEKWICWIRGCLESGMGSVLVNGSPTKEFKYKRGLRQGDPLAPFLFIIAMEIYLVTGLKVNRQKSKVFGIGVKEDEVVQVANLVNCEAGNLPFTYLGIPIGANMKRAKFWKPIVDKFTAKLSKWKARYLSFAGRMTLAKSVLGSLLSYFLSLFSAPKCIIKKLEKIRRDFLWGKSSSRHNMRWIKWDLLLKSRKDGGMGMGGIQEFNLAMLSKWWWRIKVNLSQLWAEVVAAVHRGISASQSLIPIKKSVPGVWKDIASVEVTLSKIGIDIKEKFVQDGSCWKWGNDPAGSFTVKQVRIDIEKALHQQADDGFMYEWNNWATSKANYLLWRVMLGKVASKIGLMHRGITLGDTMCPRCGLYEENTDHIFVNCLLAKCVWWNVLAWVRIKFTECDNLKDFITLITQSPGDKVWKKAVYMIAIATIWRIWWARNEKLFEDNFIPFNRMVDQIKEDTYVWICNRSKLKPLKWDNWKVFDIVGIM